MGTKNNPGKYDCYKEAANDEPLFVLRAKDLQAPSLVELWATQRELDIAFKRREDTPAQRAKIQEARQCAIAMRGWRVANVKDGQ